LTSNVKIDELNEENWYECCELKLSEKQTEYLESNALSIAQSKFEPSLKPFAIYYEDKVVGFLMFNTEKEELDGYWVFRIMVDEKCQGKGIGKSSRKLLMGEMSKLADAEKIVVGSDPENQEAHHLDVSLVFIDNGDRCGKEMAVIKYLNK